MINKILAGVDEVGRGCLAGPVISCALILRKSINKKFLKDSINVDVESNPVINISDEKINQSKEKFKIDLKKTNILLKVQEHL